MKAFYSYHSYLYMSLCTIKYVVNHMNVNKNIKYAQLKRKKFLMPIYPGVDRMATIAL